VIREATGQLRDTIPGADVWHWSGQSLATAQEMTITPDPDALTAAVEIEMIPRRTSETRRHHVSRTR
jgi:hypothetical protein